MPDLQPTRRQLLAGGGRLVVGFSLAGSLGGVLAGPGPALAKSVAGDEVGAYLSIAADGVATVYTGKVDLGTGIRTAIMQMAAEELDVRLDAIRIVEGDTDLVPDQGPTWASLSVQVAGVQIRQAAATARKALLDLGALGNAGFGTPMGTKEQIDPIAHLVSTAAGWGLNPPTEAVYKMVTPAQNDGTTPHQMVMKDIPVDAFWSVSVYDKDGFFAPNSLNVNALNSVSAKAAADGSQTIRFGGCDAGVENCIPITEGWNYTLRLYRPHAEVIDGSWTAPVAEVVK